MRVRYNANEDLDLGFIQISAEKEKEVATLCELFFKNPDISAETYFRLSGRLCELLRTEDIYPDFTSDARGDFIKLRYFKNGGLRHELRANKKGIIRGKILL